MLQFILKKMTRALSPLYHSFCHLVFPSHCRHCHMRMPPHSPLLCFECATLLEWIDPQTRCATCFNPLEEETAFACHACWEYPSLYQGVAAVFDYQGAAASLVKRLKYGNQTYLAKGMAACLVVQWEQLGWPIPDVIVPVPIPFSRWIERGYNQSGLLAQEMQKLLKVPVFEVLKRRSGDYPQASLNLEERKTLEQSSFQLKKGMNLRGKNVLLVDDVITSGLTLQRCAETILLEHSCQLYGLAFCRTLAFDA